MRRLFLIFSLLLIFIMKPLWGAEKPLFVVLDNDTTTEYSRNIKKAVTAMWTISKYKFITLSEFNAKHVGSQTDGFIGKRALSWTASDEFGHFRDSAVRYFEYKASYKDKENPNGIYLTYGPEGRYRSYYQRANKSGKTNQQIFYELNTADYFFIVSYLQTNVNWEIMPGVKVLVSTGFNKPANIYMHKKTLVCTKKFMDYYKFDVADMESKYGHPFKVLSDEELQKAIISKDPNIVYMVTENDKVVKSTNVNTEPNVWSGKTLPVFVVDAETGVVFYHLSLAPSEFKMGLKRFRTT